MALVTLTFGLLVDNLVFHLSFIYNFGAGITLNPPSFIHNNQQLAWLGLVIFCPGRPGDRYAAAVDLRLCRQRGPVERASRADDWPQCGGDEGRHVRDGSGDRRSGRRSPSGDVRRTRAVPDFCATFSGLIWLAVLVTVGVRSTSAALIAGLSFSFIPAVFASYLPTSWERSPARPVRARRRARRP